MERPESRHWVLMLAEMRRFPQVSYKADIIVLSGLDDGDMKAIDKTFKKTDDPCQIDKEDRRFVLKGSSFSVMEVVNTLTETRGYKMEYNPQQHNIPLKQGNVDDKFALMYHFWKPSAVSKSIAADSTTSLPTLDGDPLPPPRTDSLPGHKLDEVDFKK